MNVELLSRKVSAEAVSISRTSPSRDPLLSSVQYLKGVGPSRAKALKDVGVNTVEDLLYYQPRRYVDRSTLTPIKGLRVNEQATVYGQVESLGVKPGRKTRFIVFIGDGTGFLACVWFRGFDYVRRAFKEGDQVLVSGTVRYFNGLQIPHPEFEVISGKGDDDLIHTGRIIPLYPSTAHLQRLKLDSRGFRRLIKQALIQFSNHLGETLPPTLISRHHLPPLNQAVAAVHFPETGEAAQRARERLAFDELFYLELILAQRKNRAARIDDGIVFRNPGPLVRKLLNLLPFQLTGAQRRVMREIWADMNSPHPMNRLLQGDVGSGKTVIALLAMITAVENGYQAALMAPTEILAEQHYLTIRPSLEAVGVHVSLLVGGLGRIQRDEVLSSFKSGASQVIIGTHALIQEDVEFAQLGLVIIDEQHRFGVVQRVTLGQKGRSPDIIVMTATPIPRTLALTVYGDLDISVIDELPPGRNPAKTVWRDERGREKIYQFIRMKIQGGRQVYVVCPLVEESEKSDLKAATEMAERLQEIFPQFRLALLHGRMKSSDKEHIMNCFRRGEIDILVCTTVIEVGIDVPNATIMLIEHAERFGLSQLHQLRGRVGRGEHRSYCILLVTYPLSEEARERLRAMCETNDGFQIAEVDLKLRGPGEFLGTRQHGLPELRVANLATDIQLLSLAREEAFQLIDEDPHLMKPQHALVKRTLERKYRSKVDLINAG